MDFRQLTKDFNQRYSESWVFLSTPEGLDELVYLHRAFLKDENDFPYLEISSESLGTNVVKFNTDYAIKFKRPPLGVFQHNEIAYVIWRNTSQTYSKGINEQAYNIIPTCSMVINHKPYRFKDTIKSAFKRKTFSLSIALDKLKNHKFKSVALSSRISIALSASDFDSYDVYHYSYFIGKTDLNGKPIGRLAELTLKEFE